MYTKAELEALSTRELADLVGAKLGKGRPSKELRDELISDAKAAKVRKV